MLADIARDLVRSLWREHQEQLAQALQTGGWREALLGFFPSAADR